MIDEALIQDLDAQQLRDVVRTLIVDVKFKQTTIDKEPVLNFVFEA